MNGPPLDPRYVTEPKEATWRCILASYGTFATLLLLLWTASYPAAGAVVVTTGIGSLAVGRGAWRLGRCFYDCDGFSINLAGRVRITITQP